MATEKSACKSVCLEQCVLRKGLPIAGDAQEPLPEGWSEAKDAQQRTYYWHTKTKKVQWERPTAATPA